MPPTEERVTTFYIYIYMREGGREGGSRKLELECGLVWKSESWREGSRVERGAARDREREWGRQTDLGE